MDGLVQWKNQWLLGSEVELFGFCFLREREKAAATRWVQVVIRSRTNPG